MLLNESSIEQINLFAANANESHHRAASSISSSTMAADADVVNNPATDHQNNVDIGALLASQDSNVFRVSSEVANAAEKGEADGDTVVDLNRIGVQEALMPPPTTTNN